ncbi:MAG: rod shape-determining protein MreD [Alphaproteobacteria bacterium]|nr:rod shape-determining protein MreD [Alphaproteobacteria bacterium]TAD88116.1 MAG: rod shape-determining protein MreD [Alphaproteobacteria bacterium]
MAQPSLWERLDTRLRSITPALVTVVMALVSVLPIGWQAPHPAVPAFTLMSVYYWTVYRPDLLPPVAVFVIGVFQDLLTGGLVGVTALLLLATHGVLLGQRKLFLGKPFWLAWIGFALVAAAAGAAQYLIVATLYWTLVPIGQAVMQALTTVLAFPLLAWFFIRTHRRVVARV